MCDPTISVLDISGPTLVAAVCLDVSLMFQTAGFPPGNWLGEWVSV